LHKLFNLLLDLFEGDLRVLIRGARCLSLCKWYEIFSKSQWGWGHCFFKSHTTSYISLPFPQYHWPHPYPLPYRGGEWTRTASFGTRYHFSGLTV